MPFVSAFGACPLAIVLSRNEAGALATDSDLPVQHLDLKSDSCPHQNEAQDMCAGTRNHGAGDAWPSELAVGRDLQPGQSKHLVGQPWSLNLIIHAADESHLQLMLSSAISGEGKHEL